jgi:peptidoglycan/xylan/chitin deacetylase (PgdA/CDA1 family)
MGNLLRNRSSRATFLCYHSIAPAGPRYLTVTAELFERQLAELRRRGLRGGGPAELREAAAGASPRPTVFLSFDDGFRDNHATALALLREYGFPAFCFVLPPLVDSGGPLAWPEVADDQRRFGETMRSVTWPMVEEMREGGIEIGSHTLSHRLLPSLSPERLREELWDSRARIKERLGSCDTVAYPFGRWNPEVAAAARDCGYEFAFTLPEGTGQWGATAHSIPRINVDYRDEPRRYRAKLGRPGKEAVLSPAVAALRRRLRRRPVPAGAPVGQ